MKCWTPKPGRYTLVTKSTVVETGDKSATKSTVAYTIDFVASFGNKSARTWIRPLVAVDTVANSVDFFADMVDFVTSVYGAKATRLTFSTFHKVDHVEFIFVASVYRALEPSSTLWIYTDTQKSTKSDNYKKKSRIGILDGFIKEKTITAANVFDV